MTRKKIFIIISLIITALMVVLIIINLYSNETKNKIKTDYSNPSSVAENLAYKWFNYKIQTDISYNEALKPLLTEDFYKNTLYVNTERPQDFVGQKPLKSEIISSKQLSSEQNLTKIEVIISSKEDGSPISFEQVVVIQLIKNGTEWKANYLEIVEQSY
jgi:hypothetical protein